MFESFKFSKGLSSPWNLKKNKKNFNFPVLMQKKLFGNPLSKFSEGVPKRVLITIWGSKGKPLNC
jgi:hypothetical protein